MENPDNYNILTVPNFISIFYRIGVSYLSQKYESYHIGYGQYQFLIALYVDDGLSQDELTKRVSVDKATTTRAINKLKELGYITVSVDETDKRIRRVWLTDHARMLKDEIFGIAQDWEHKILHALSEEDKQIMTDLFYKIAVSNDWLPNSLLKK